VTTIQQGYARSRTGRSIDDARRRGREALTATRGATALTLDPAVAPRKVNPVAAPAVKAAVPDPVGLPAGGAERSPRSSSPASQPASVKAPARVPAKRPALTPVPPAPVSAPRAPFVTLVLIVVIVGVLGILVINTKINENAFHLHDLRNQQMSLDRQEQKLNKEIADRESPGNLAAAARQLGLVRAEAPAYLRLPDGRQLGVPRPAAGPASGSGGSAAARPKG
jgi:hypothetical protein